MRKLEETIAVVILEFIFMQYKAIRFSNQETLLV